jgi:hypothetical protein
VVRVVSRNVGDYFLPERFLLFWFIHLFLISLPLFPAFIYFLYHHAPSCLLCCCVPHLLIPIQKYIPRILMHVSRLLRWLCLLAGFAELISSTLKMEVICSCETSVETQRATRRHIPDDDTLHKHLCENLKPKKICSL